MHPSVHISVNQWFRNCGIGGHLFILGVFRPSGPVRDDADGEVGMATDSYPLLLPVAYLVTG